MGRIGKMRTIWKSNLSKPLKRISFRTFVEIVLLCSSETWTLAILIDKKSGWYVYNKVNSCTGYYM